MGKVVDGRFKHGSKTKNPPLRGEIQPPKKSTGGNCKPDREWIAEMHEDLEEISKEQLKALDIPWDVQVRFNGYAEEVNPEFFEAFRRGDRRCSGAAYVRDDRGGYIIDLDAVRIMRPCLMSPRYGSNVCPKHGGEIGHVKKAAQVRLAMASDNAAATLVNLSRPTDELGNVVEQAQRIKAASNVLDRVGIRAGVEVEVTAPAYQQIMDGLFSDDGDANS